MQLAMLLVLKLSRKGLRWLPQTSLEIVDLELSIEELRRMP